MDKVRAGLPAAFNALGADQGAAAARAIMTTDLSPKESAARITIGGRDATIGGMAKGAGMIEPNMATMLGFVTTDASVPKPLLDRALRDAVERSFNAITVDGDSSTNRLRDAARERRERRHHRRGELRRVPRGG